MNGASWSRPEETAPPERYAVRFLSDCPTPCRTPGKDCRLERRSGSRMGPRGRGLLGTLSRVGRATVAAARDDARRRTGAAPRRPPRLPWADGRHARRRPRPAFLTEPVHYIAFDLLYLGGRSLVNLPLYERRRILHDALPPSSIASPCEGVIGDGVAMFKRALAAGHEGGAALCEWPVRRITARWRVPAIRRRLRSSSRNSFH